MRARAGNFFSNPLEKEIHSAVIQHWRTLGQPMTLVATWANEGAMGQPGLTCGLPDLLIMGPDIPGPFPIAFMELKRDHRARLTDAQLDFAHLCARLGILCPVVFGRDEPIAYLEKWNIVRAQRYPEPPGYAERFEVERP
jgi:hypothetical protein